jgi:hypothetical protein
VTGRVLESLAARAIFKRRGHAVELQPQSVADKSTSCPLCGKAGIRLVAFTDPAGVGSVMGLPGLRRGPPVQAPRQLETYPSVSATAIVP